MTGARFILSVYIARLAMFGLALTLLVSCGGLSPTYKETFMSGCLEDPRLGADFCECVLNYLDDLGKRPEDITPEEGEESFATCKDKMARPADD